MRAFWLNCANVGDILTPFLLRTLTGQTVVHDSHPGKWIVSGSILHCAAATDIILGTGTFRSRPWSTPPKLTVLLVRGPRTAKYLDRSDVPMGDAGLLMPCVIPLPQKPKRYKWGIIPHYVDEMNVTNLPEDITLISVSLPVEQFIARLSECHNIASSSLHGIILAEAYGIPTVRVRFTTSTNIHDFDFKHADYYEGTQRSLPSAITIEQAIQQNPPVATQVLTQVDMLRQTIVDNPQSEFRQLVMKQE